MQYPELSVNDDLIGRVMARGGDPHEVGGAVGSYRHQVVIYNNRIKNQASLGDIVDAYVHAKKSEVALEHGRPYYKWGNQEDRMGGKEEWFDPEPLRALFK